MEKWKCKTTHRELGIFEGMLRGRNLEGLRHFLPDVGREEDRIRFLLRRGMVDVQEMAAQPVDRATHQTEDQRKSVHTLCHPPESTQDED